MNSMRAWKLLLVAVCVGLETITGSLQAEDKPEAIYVPYDVRDAVVALGELLAPEWDKLSAEERGMASRPLLMQIRNM